MNKFAILGILRHVLTAGGGVAVGLGYADQGTVTELIGAALTIAGFVLSIYAPEKRG
jgi:hypothetical protein